MLSSLRKWIANGHGVTKYCSCYRHVSDRSPPLDADVPPHVTNRYRLFQTCSKWLEMSNRRSAPIVSTYWQALICYYNIFYYFIIITSAKHWWVYVCNKMTPLCCMSVRRISKYVFKFFSRAVRLASRVGPDYPISAFALPLSIHFLIFCSFLLFPFFLFSFALPILFYCPSYCLLFYYYGVLLYIHFGLV